MFNWALAFVYLCSWENFNPNFSVSSPSSAGEYILLLQRRILPHAAGKKQFFLLLQEKIHPPPPAVEKGNIWLSLCQRASWLAVDKLCSFVMTLLCSSEKSGTGDASSAKTTPCYPPSHTCADTFTFSLCGRVNM